MLVDEGYLSVAKNSFAKARNDAKVKDDDSVDNKDDNKCDAALFEVLKNTEKVLQSHLMGLISKKVKLHLQRDIIQVLLFLQWRMQDSLLKMRNCGHRLRVVE